MPGSTYLLVALPSSIHPSNDPAEAFASLRTTVPPDAGTISSFPIPEFKIGTLDALVLQADELGKLDMAVEVAVAKVVDVLRSVIDDPHDAARHQTVNDSACPPLSPLSPAELTPPPRRARRTLSQQLQLEQGQVPQRPIDRVADGQSAAGTGAPSSSRRALTPQQEVISLDTDIKTHFTAYQAVKSTLVSVQRKQTYPAPPSSRSCVLSH